MASEQQDLISHSSGGCESGQGAGMVGFGHNPLWWQSAGFSPCPHMAERAGEPSGAPFMRHHPHDLTTPRSHTLTVTSVHHYFLVCLPSNSCPHVHLPPQQPQSQLVPASTVTSERLNQTGVRRETILVEAKVLSSCEAVKPGKGRASKRRRWWHSLGRTVPFQKDTQERSGQVPSKYKT